MSNRPKGFKRIPIFYRAFNGKIKKSDERLPNDEYYQRLVKPIRYGGRMKLKKIFDTLKYRTSKYSLYR